MTRNIPLAEVVKLETSEYDVFDVDHLFSNLYRIRTFTNVHERCINCCRECIKTANIIYH